MDFKSYTILIQNLLNRATEIAISEGRGSDFDYINSLVDKLKLLVKGQLEQYKGE